MEFEPYTELSPIKPVKPISDLNQGVLYLNGNSMTDIEMHAMSSIKTIEFEPEPLDIINLMPKNVFWNVKPMTMSMVAKIKPSFINDNIILGKPVGPWEMRKYDQIQKRKHHKTRINKKWAKKYGCWTVEDVFKVNSLNPKDIVNEKLTYEGNLEFKERRIY